MKGEMTRDARYESFTRDFPQDSQQLMTLFEYRIIATGATIFGKKIRVDETGKFPSIKDCIMIIGGCDAKAAQHRIGKLKADDIISTDHPGIIEFKHVNQSILGARLVVVAYVCFQLKSKRARLITKKIFEIGLRCFETYQKTYVNLNRNDESLAEIVHSLEQKSTGMMALLEYQRTATGATIFGKEVRVDETGMLLSIKDCIMIIDECDAKSAQFKLNLFRTNNIINTAHRGFTGFKHVNHNILATRLSIIAFVCFHLKSERARTITRRVFEVGIRYIEEDHSETELSFGRRIAGTKERDVFKFIKQEFIGDVWVFNRRVENYSRYSYRPDALLRLSSHAIVVEVDENQHSSYDVVAETNRIQTIQENVRTPLIVIRLNTDKCIDNTGSAHDPKWKLNTSGDLVAHHPEEWQLRLQALKTQIKYHMAHIPSEPILEIRLFFTNKH
jgi:hypothetical protein